LKFRFIWAAAACLAGSLLAAPAGPAAAMPPQDRLGVLGRGVNLTNWFRFPARTDAASMRTYLSDSAIEALRGAGFTFVRLAVQPEYLQSDPSRRGLLVGQIARLERHHLGVVVALHPATWHLESSATDRAALLAVWRALAPALGALDPRLTFPEPLNEPVFAGDPDGWERLQTRLLAVIRAALPASTVVLTGNDWGSIIGLMTVHPVTDANVIYSFHFYDPAELTSLAAWRPGLDSAALARLPFPVSDPTGCEVELGRTDSATRDVARFYCTLRWTPASIDKRIDEAAQWAGRAHVALLAGEFGATARLNRPSRLAWLRAVRLACERHGIGWALWGYDDAMGLGVPHPPGPLPVLDEGVLDALGLGKSAISDLR
jgi:endoglucanase